MIRCLASCLRDLFGPGWAAFCRLDFNNAFLSDIAAFEGVVIGILLPLAWDAISRSADKYGDIIIARFREHLPTRVLLPSFVLHIVLAIATRLISTESNLAYPSSKVWGLFLFVWFIANLFIFIQYLHLLHTYTFNIKEVVDRLFEDAHDSIRKS